VSVAEVNGHDLPQRATLGLALVAADGPHLHTQMQAIREALHENPAFQVLEVREETWGAGDMGGWTTTSPDL
jgi:uncharacterized protein YlxP (DUF503 family)